MTEYERIQEKMGELKDELAGDEALLTRCFPNVFDGTLEWGVYDDKKEEYGEIIKAVVEELIEPFLSLDGIEIKATDQSLPENPYGNPKEFFGAGCYTHAQTDMTEADFVKVIPKGR